MDLYERNLKRLLELTKSAEDEKQKKPLWPPLEGMKNLAGFGIGTAAGCAGMEAANWGLKRYTGQSLRLNPALRVAIPAMSAAVGLAIPYFLQAGVDKMRENHLKRQEMKHGKHT